MRFVKTFASAAFMLVVGMAPAFAADARIVLGLQESGTVQWEIAAIEALGLDDQHGIALEIRPLADSRAGQIALQTGAIDIILSDFVWVSAQRHQGGDVTMVPHSLAVGGVVVPAQSPIGEVADLKGRTLGVAGGPADKSWAVLQAYYASRTGGVLADDATIRFGAPPLINELLASGGVDAGLNFWHWNARAKAVGMREVASVADMFEALGVESTPPLLGWTFSEALAEQKGDALRRFLDASFDAKAALSGDDAIWADLAGLMGVADDSALFVQLRDGYRAGIVGAPDPAQRDLAEKAFAILARFGGGDVVGTQTRLSQGTFWEGYAK